MGRTALPRPAHSPDLAHSGYHLFGPVKDALGGRHSVDDNEMKVFVMCSEVESQDFTTLVHSVLFNVGRSELKMKVTLWKNNLTIAKDI
jgi:hypothetical protein